MMMMMQIHTKLGIFIDGLLLSDLEAVGSAGLQIIVGGAGHDGRKRMDC